jgi:predicted negative regulator of RcsB-dependent stress response
MSKQHRILSGTAALGLAVGMLSGCSASPEENVTKACGASDAFAAAVKNFRATLTPNATIEEIRSAREKVSSTYNDLKGAAANVAKDRTDALASATDDLKSAVDAVPDNATVRQAVASLKNEAAKVETARTGVASELNC